VFTDRACSRVDSSQRSQLIPVSTIRPRSISSSSVQVTTSNKTIAYAGADNTISVTFLPQSTMSPSGAGSIHLLMPYWY